MPRLGDSCAWKFREKRKSYRLRKCKSSAVRQIGAPGEATQSSTAYEGHARLAIDGNTDGDYEKAKSTSHTDASENPWWEVDLKTARAVDRIVIWNRTDNEPGTRLKDSGFLIGRET